MASGNNNGTGNTEGNMTTATIIDHGDNGITYAGIPGNRYEVIVYVNGIDVDEFACKSLARARKFARSLGELHGTAPVKVTVAKAEEV